MSCLLNFIYLARSDIQHQGIQYIIDSTIESFLENPDRRFIYVEMAYFWRWWREQTEDLQNTVRQLVNQGQFIEQVDYDSTFLPSRTSL